MLGLINPATPRFVCGTGPGTPCALVHSEIAMLAKRLEITDDVGR